MNANDWLGYLFKVMLDGISSPAELIERNKIGFITFNYDRLLERWLHRRIKYSFGIDDDAAVTEPHRWVLASKDIRTIFDTEHDQSILDAAKALLASASRICLLGFGFHRENIDLLDMTSFMRARKEIVASSRYDIRDTLRILRLCKRVVRVSA